MVNYEANPQPESSEENKAKEARETEKSLSDLSPEELATKASSLRNELFQLSTEMTKLLKKEDGKEEEIAKLNRLISSLNMSNDLVKEELEGRAASVASTPGKALQFFDSAKQRLERFQDPDKKKLREIRREERKGTPLIEEKQRLKQETVADELKEKAPRGKRKKFLLRRISRFFSAGVGDRFLTKFGNKTSERRREEAREVGSLLSHAFERTGPLKLGGDLLEEAIFRNQLDKLIGSGSNIMMAFSRNKKIRANLVAFGTFLQESGVIGNFTRDKLKGADRNIDKEAYDKVLARLAGLKENPTLIAYLQRHKYFFAKAFKAIAVEGGSDEDNSAVDLATESATPASEPATAQPSAEATGVGQGNNQGATNGGGDAFRDVINDI